MYLYGSMCLSDVPKELFRKADNGKVYLNLRIFARREEDKFGNTHIMSCAPKKEEQKEGVNYLCGSFKMVDTTITPEQVEKLPAAADNDLPF